MLKMEKEKSDNLVEDITEDPEIQTLLEDNHFIQLLDSMDGSPKLILSLLSKIYPYI